MEILSVGQPYDTSITTWPEGCHYNYDRSGHWLHYLYNNPTSSEISSIQKGEAQFGLYICGPVLFLLHQFGEMAWNDAPYSWWLVSEDFREIPASREGIHALLKVVMIDTATGIVVALRALTFSAEFTAYLHESIRKQLQEPHTREHHDRIVRSVYADYSTIDLVRRGEIFCKGGE